jgi:hypothetical protein
MNYEEKRQTYLAISQLLADAGLNQHTIKEMVEKEVYNKVDREVKNAIQRLNETTYSGDYIKEKIQKRIANDYVTASAIETAVKEELRNRIIKVVLDKCE